MAPRKFSCSCLGYLKPFAWVDRINEHHAYNVAGIGARKEAYGEGTERVPHEYKRSFDSGIEQQRTEFLNNLPAGAGAWGPHRSNRAPRDHSCMRG